MTGGGPPLPAATRPFDWRDGVDIAGKFVWPLLVLGITLTVHRMEAGETRERVEKQEEALAEQTRLSSRRALYSYLSTGLPEQPEDVGHWRSGVQREILLQFCGDARLNGAGDRATEPEKVLKIVCGKLRSVRPTSRQLTETRRQVARALQAGDPSVYLDSSVAQQAQAQLSLREAAEAAPAEGIWFAVVGTIPIGDDRDRLRAARRLAAALERRFEEAGLTQRVRVFRTELSDSYALTLGGGTAQAQAQALVDQARRLNIVPDAFAQRDRNWKPVSVSA